MQFNDLISWMRCSSLPYIKTKQIRNSLVLASRIKITMIMMTHLKPKTGRNCWKSFFQSRKIGVEKQQSIRYCYYIEYQSVTSDYVVHYKISCQRSQMHIYTDAHLQFSFFLLFFFWFNAMTMTPSSSVKTEYRKKIYKMPW